MAEKKIRVVIETKAVKMRRRIRKDKKKKKKAMQKLKLLPLRI